MNWNRLYEAFTGEQSDCVYVQQFQASANDPEAREYAWDSLTAHTFCTCAQSLSYPGPFPEWVDSYNASAALTGRRPMQSMIYGKLYPTIDSLKGSNSAHVG